MVRIGIVGSDGSHSIYFPQLVNLPQGLNGLRIEGAKAVAIWGAERKRTEEVARKGNISEIVAYPEDMIGKVDAVMVVLRHGGIHYQFSRPFIEARVPIFIDKPFTCSVENAKKIIDLAKQHDVLMTSFSTLRYDETTVKFKEALKDKGRIIAGHILGAADVTSEYGGLFFMGVHIVELCQEIFGPGAQSLMACNQYNNIAVTVRYPDERIINFMFLKYPPYHEIWQVSIYGKQGSSRYCIGEGTNYYCGMKKFLEMVGTQKMPLSFDDILESVVLLKAIEVSLASKKEISLSQVS